LRVVLLMVNLNDEDFNLHADIQDKP
jgi:hypothetical protein